MKGLFTIALLFTVQVAAAARFDCSLEAPKERQQDKLVWQFVDEHLFLSTQEADLLNTKLAKFARETSNQILVLVVDTLCGYPASDLAFEIGEKWGIGQEKFDNGIVILIKPTGASGQRKVFIATGYGLEGAIPDLTAKRIVDREILPRFKTGNYYDALNEATDVLMGLAIGEFNAKSYGKKSFPWPLLFFVLIFIVVVFASARNRAKRYAKLNNVDLWTAWWLLSQMDRKHRGNWGGFTGGGGGGFGGGGGGFGGFGGGSSGGGGAGGSW